MSKTVTLNKYAEMRGINVATIFSRRQSDKSFPKPTNRHGNAYVWGSLALDRYFEAKPVRTHKSELEEAKRASDLLASQNEAATIAEQLSSNSDPGIVSPAATTNDQVLTRLHGLEDTIVELFASLEQKLNSINEKVVEHNRAATKMLEDLGKKVKEQSVQDDMKEIRNFLVNEEASHVEIN